MSGPITVTAMRRRIDELDALFRTEISGFFLDLSENMDRMSREDLLAIRSKIGAWEERIEKEISKLGKSKANGA